MLSEFETKTSKYIRMSLLYIVGYVTRIDCPTEEDMVDNTSFIFKNMEIFWKK